MEEKTKKKKIGKTSDDLLQARANFIEEYKRVKAENGFSDKKMVDEMCKTGLSISENTLRDTISNGFFNIKTALAFCHCFNVDINKIFFSDEKTVPQNSNKSNPHFLYAKDFINSCLKSEDGIGSVYMTFRSGGEWLEHDAEKALLAELNNKGIMVKVIVNHGKAIKEMTDSMYSDEEKKTSLDVNDCVKLWGRFEKIFNNLSVCVSDLPILRRLTIVNFKNGTSRAFVRDYAYNFSDGWEFASVTYDENDYLINILKKEFDYLWSKSRSFSKWEIDETSEPSEITNYLKYCSNDFIVLDDEKFFGKYYGYCYNSNGKNMDSFELVIDYNSAHEVQADLYLHAFHLSNNLVNGERKEKTLHRVLHGVPMRIRDIIYIMFQQDTGDEIYAMEYKWFSINHGTRLYFRHGAFLTPVRGETRIPSIKSFIMSDKPIEEKNLHYIKGYLKLNNPYIFVPADSLENAIKTNPILKKYIETTKFDLTTDKCYAIAENSIAQCGENKDVDFDDIAEIICLLKEWSMNPTLISYPDDKTISRYIASLCEENVESDETELTE